LIAGGIVDGSNGRSPGFAAVSGKSGIALLHHLRWVAALAVAVSHIRNHVLVDFPAIDGPGPMAFAVYALSGYGHAAVVVFFVISGYLVGGKAVELYVDPEIEESWKYFLVDRFSRIFIVLWPSLVLSAAIVSFVVHVLPDAPFAISTDWDSAWLGPISKDMSPEPWLYAALLINETVGPTIFVNSPLWSLAYEWFYYMAALAIVLLVRRVFISATAILFAYVALLIIVVLMSKPAIIMGGIVWTMGLVAKIASDRRWLGGRASLLAGIALTIGALAYSRTHVVDDCVIGALLAFVIAHARWRAWSAGEKFGRRLADFSFSLYVTHMPIAALVIVLVQSSGFLRERMQFGFGGVAMVVVLSALTIAFSRLFAMATEERTGELRRWLMKRARRVPVG